MTQHRERRRSSLSTVRCGAIRTAGPAACDATAKGHVHLPIAADVGIRGVESRSTWPAMKRARL